MPDIDEDRRAITLGQEIRKEVGRCGAYFADHIAVTGYLAGCAETFAHALADSSLCGNGAPIDVRESMHSPEIRGRIYNSAIDRIRKYPRHLPESLKEEFFGLVKLLSDGEQVLPEKAKIVAGVVVEYLKDYLGGIGSVQVYGELPDY